MSGLARVAAEESFGDGMMTSFLLLGLVAGNDVEVVKSTWEALVECDVLHHVPAIAEAPFPM